MEENKNIQEETAPEKETNFKMPKIKLPEFNLPKLDLSKLKRLKLKKNAKILLLAVVLLVLVVYGMLTIPGMIDRNNLKKLGYSEEAITKIYELEWEGMILTDELYSDNLNRSIVKENFRKEFLDLYLMTDSLNDDDFLLYSKLILKGY